LSKPSFVEAVLIGRQKDNGLILHPHRCDGIDIIGTMLVELSSYYCTLQFSIFQRQAPWESRRRNARPFALP
jgi:hypothetical protein